MNKIDSGVLARAEQMLADFGERRRKHGYQHYGSVGVADIVPDHAGGFGCYGNAYMMVNKNDIFVEVSFSRTAPRKNDAIVIEYLNYWANDSFLAPVFILKDGERILRAGGGLYDLSFSGQQVISAAMGVRDISDDDGFVERWKEFKDAGMHPDLANLAARMVYKAADGGGWEYHNNWGSHTWFQHYSQQGIPKEIVGRILQRNLVSLPAFRDTHGVSYSPLMHILIADKAIAKDYAQETRYNPHNLPTPTRMEIKNSFGKVHGYRDNFIAKERLGELVDWSDKLVKAHVRKPRKSRWRKEAPATLASPLRFAAA